MDVVNPANATPAQSIVVTATFKDKLSAQNAIAELRYMGIPPENITLTSNDAGTTLEPGLSGTAEVQREAVEDIGPSLAHSSTYAPPNDEDLATTGAHQTGQRLPIDFGPEVPPDEPLGGSRQLGLDRDSDMVRRTGGFENANVDIYTDFPGEPGGVNPDSPASAQAAASAPEQAVVNSDEPGTLATLPKGSTRLSVRFNSTVRDAVVGVLSTHGGQNIQ